MSYQYLFFRIHRTYKTKFLSSFSFSHHVYFRFAIYLQNNINEAYPAAFAHLCNAISLPYFSITAFFATYPLSDDHFSN